MQFSSDIDPSLEYNSILQNILEYSLNTNPFFSTKDNFSISLIVNGILKINTSFSFTIVFNSSIDSLSFVYEPPTMTNIFDQSKVCADTHSGSRSSTPVSEFQLILVAK